MGQVYAVEMFNEPEWMIDKKSSATKAKISLTDAQKFVAACNSVITANGFKATIGSASLKWSCKQGKGCAGDWWGNTGISFRTVHYYDWMAKGGNTYDPFSTKPSDWGFYSEKILIGETPGVSKTLTLKHGYISIKDQYSLAHQNGWLGLMPWSEFSRDGHGDWNTIKQGLTCSANWNMCKPPAKFFEQVEENEEISFLQ